MNVSTSYIILVTFSPKTPEFMLLTIAPFSTIRQKLVYHVEYLRISWTSLDPLYRFGRVLVGKIIPMFVWQSPKGHCYGNQSREMFAKVTWNFSSAFDNGLADRKSTFKRFNGNNQATLCPNLVYFRPLTSICC